MGFSTRDTGYVFETRKLKWIEGAQDAVKAISEAGYFAFVVTNQSGIARGMFNEDDVQALSRLDGRRIGKDRCTHRRLRVLP